MNEFSTSRPHSTDNSKCLRGETRKRRWTMVESPIEKEDFEHVESTDIATSPSSYRECLSNDKIFLNKVKEKSNELLLSTYVQKLNEPSIEMKVIKDDTNRINSMINPYHRDTCAVNMKKSASKCRKKEKKTLKIVSDTQMTRNDKFPLSESHKKSRNSMFKHDTKSNTSNDSNISNTVKKLYIKGEFPISNTKSDDDLIDRSKSILDSDYSNKKARIVNIKDIPIFTNKPAAKNTRQSYGLIKPNKNSKESFEKVYPPVKDILPEPIFKRKSRRYHRNKIETNKSQECIPNNKFKEPQFSSTNGIHRPIVNKSILSNSLSCSRTDQIIGDVLKPDSHTTELTHNNKVIKSFFANRILSNKPNSGVKIIPNDIIAVKNTFNASESYSNIVINSTGDVEDLSPVISSNDKQHVTDIRASNNSTESNTLSDNNCSTNSVSSFNTELKKNTINEEVGQQIYMENMAEDQEILQLNNKTVCVSTKRDGNCENSPNNEECSTIYLNTPLASHISKIPYSDDSYKEKKVPTRESQISCIEKPLHYDEFMLEVRRRDRLVLSSVNLWKSFTKKNLVILMNEIIHRHSGCKNKNVTSTNNICNVNNFEDVNFHYYRKTSRRLKDLHSNMSNNYDKLFDVLNTSEKGKLIYKSNDDTSPAREGVNEDVNEVQVVNTTLQKSIHLLTINPYTLSLDECRKTFVELHQLAIELSKQLKLTEEQNDFKRRITELANEIMNYELKISTLQGKLSVAENKIQKLTSIQKKILQELQLEGDRLEKEQILNSKLISAKYIQVTSLQDKLTEKTNEVLKLMAELEKLRNDKINDNSDLHMQLELLYDKLGHKSQLLSNISDEINDRIQDIEQREIELNKYINDSTFKERCEEFSVANFSLEEELKNLKIHYWNLKKAFITTEDKYTNSLSNLSKCKNVCEKQHSIINLMKKEETQNKIRIAKFNRLYNAEKQLTERWKKQYESQQYFIQELHQQYCFILNKSQELDGRTNTQKMTHIDTSVFQNKKTMHNFALKVLTQDNNPHSSDMIMSSLHAEYNLSTKNTAHRRSSSQPLSGLSDHCNKLNSLYLKIETLEVSLKLKDSELRKMTLSLQKQESSSKSYFEEVKRLETVVDAQQKLILGYQQKETEYKKEKALVETLKTDQAYIQQLEEQNQILKNLVNNLTKYNSL